MGTQVGDTFSPLRFPVNIAIWSFKTTLIPWLAQLAVTKMSVGFTLSVARSSDRRSITTCFHRMNILLLEALQNLLRSGLSSIKTGLPADKCRSGEKAVSSKCPRIYMLTVSCASRLRSPTARGASASLSAVSMAALTCSEVQSCQGTCTRSKERNEQCPGCLFYRMCPVIRHEDSKGCNKITLLRNEPIDVV